LLTPVMDSWPPLITPSKGRAFRKRTAIALVTVLIDHVNFRTSRGDVLFTNSLGLPGLPPHAPTLAELAEAAGMDRHTAGFVLDWLVEEGVLTKQNHGRLRATVWSVEPLMNGAWGANHPDRGG